MADLAFVPIGFVYLIVVSLLFIYGMNFFYLAWQAAYQAAWQAWRKNTPQATMPPEPDLWPVVTVQLPLYNELYVAERLIKAAARLDYPRHLLEIQVLDDSTDETVEIAAKLVRKLAYKGVNIVHIHRTERKGYKAGALAEGLNVARGEYLAIFDADFIPPVDYLKNTLPFFRDDRIGFVQTRWGHVNREDSLLTFLQSLAIDAYFLIEQYARSQKGYWFNFNGTAGIWRRSAIEDAGGWTAETLTEDLDLSYRAFLRGWKSTYLRDIVVFGELPISFSAYRRQQLRWARGRLECAQKFLPIIWKSKIPLAKKIDASFQLTAHGVHILLAILSVLYPFILVLPSRYAHLVSLFWIASAFNITAFAPLILFPIARQQLGEGWWRKIPVILFISAFGAGMMVNTLQAAIQIISKKHRIFERTPKFGVLRARQSWMNHRYQIKLDSVVYSELAFGTFNLATCLFAIHLKNFPIAFYALLFAMGLFFTSGTTILQSIKLHLKNAQMAVPSTR
jgi:cellulose synthase/poly-beta-1,6-N-acetylglucosamine synthase-like glycosyltransferase